MADDIAASKAGNETIADGAKGPEAPALDSSINDALASLSDVGGALVPNEGTVESLSKETVDEKPVTEEKPGAAGKPGAAAGSDADKKTPAADDKGAGGDATEKKDETPESAPELKVEKDESGVYDQKPVADPGEFKPGDHSFTIKTTDGKDHKITSAEDADTFADLIDADPSLLSARGWLDFNRKTGAMESGLQNDKRTYDTTKEAFDAQSTQNSLREDTISTINSGITYLQTKGILSPVPKEYDTADVKWEDHADVPAIKERLDLLTYMAKENDARLAAGLDPSFDAIAAHNAMELDALKSSNQQVEDKETKTRKKQGSMVGGASPHQQTQSEPKGSIVGEGGSLSDLIADAWQV